MNLEETLKTTKPLSENKKLVLNLLLSSNEAGTIVAEAVKPFDISVPQFNVLRILRGQQGRPANLSTVQDRMVSKMSNTTRLVDKLLEKKLVDRSTCEENRRKIEIYITDKGLKLLEKMDPALDQAEMEISKNLTGEEIVTLNSLLEKMRE